MTGNSSMTGNSASGQQRVIMLRAVNVGGAQLPMADLRAMATELGATDVSTYIATGNLIATVPGDPDAFDRAIEAAVQERFGFFREAISRTRAQLESALAAHPFEVLEPRFSYVSFLQRRPTASAIEAAKALPTGEDCWEVVGDDLHLRYADGAGREQVRTATLLRTLGVPGTARNLNTVREIVRRMDPGV